MHWRQNDTMAEERQKELDKDMHLIGIDLYIITKGGIPNFDWIEGFKCEFMSNRGRSILPIEDPPASLMGSWYRCRFIATQTISDQDIHRFLEKISETYWWSAAQKLWNYSGHPAYSSS